MKPFRKEPDLARHRRPSASTSRPASGMMYYSRRSEEALNTGRSLNREAPKRVMNLLGRFWLQRFGLAILLVAGLVCLLDILSLSTNPEIVVVTSNSTAVHSTAAYQAAASKLLSTSIWDRNKLTVNTGHLSNQLQAQFPELTSVSVTLPLLAHRPVIYVQPSAAALILNSASGSYVLDSAGKALSVDGAALTRLDLPVVTDQSGLQLSVNKQALTSNDVSFIRTIVAQLAARQFTVSLMTLPAAASELDVHITGQPYFVKFNLQSGDARQQAGTFLAVQNRLQSQHISPAQYIDVRVDGRAYYK